MTQTELLAPIVESIWRGTGLPAQAIQAELAGWQAHPLTVDGQHVGTVVSKGPEVHVALVPGYRPRACQRRIVRELLAPILEAHGFLTTRVRLSEAAPHEFVRRVGFRPTWACDRYQYYLLGVLPFTRKTP